MKIDIKNHRGHREKINSLCSPNDNLGNSTGFPSVKVKGRDKEIGFVSTEKTEKKLEYTERN